MSDLRQAVAEYLRLRRAVGYKLERDGQLLPGFIEFLERAGAERITNELAVVWAMEPAAAHPAWWRQRLSIVRGFARYLQTLDPASEVPPAELLRAHRRRMTPYLYSQADIAALLDAAGALRPPLRAATYKTIIALMSVSGLRIGEALALDRGDVDLDGGALLVHGKGGHEREVALHETTTTALAQYARLRDRHYPRPTTPAFFTPRGVRLSSGTFHDTFRALVRRAGLEGRGERCCPRPHDLRHSMAVRTLLGWYRAGENVDVKLPLLSTYLGHRDPTSSYWYLQAAPELLELAAGRLASLQTSEAEGRR
ncbi:MAG: tyrosine-type recombinase/integrase [Solirubrobacteraceae bacterium]|jgi:integrase